MNRLFNKLVNVLTRVSLDDTQCGFKAFRAPAAKLLFHCSVTERFAFDVEILTVARKLGLTISEVPVRWRHVKGSRIRPWTDVGSMARDVLRASRGAASTPPLHAVVVKLPSEGAAPGPLQQVLGPSLPVVQQRDGAVLVLCPLMSEADVAATAVRIQEWSAGALVERRVMTTAQLCALAPLSLSWGDEAVAAWVA